MTDHSSLSFDHSKRSTKYYDRVGGVCVCEHCKKLPWHGLDDAPTGFRLPATPALIGEPTPFPFYAPEPCVACGEPFDAFESRLYWSSPAHWQVRQHLGPIHSRCRRFDDAQEDALRKVLSASSPDQSGEPTPPPLHWDCWIHDSAEECEAGKCDLGYWRCPECDNAMQPDDEKPLPHRGVWRCDECDTFIDFATARPASSLAPSGESSGPTRRGGGS